MTHLSGFAGNALVKLSVQYDAGAHPRARRQEDHRPGPTAGSETPFRQGVGIGIVHEMDAAFEALLEIVDHRNSIPSRKIWRRLNGPPAKIERTTAGDADHGRPRRHLTDNFSQTLERLAVTTGGKNGVFPQAAGFGPAADGTLGASDVDAHDGTRFFPHRRSIGEKKALVLALTCSNFGLWLILILTPSLEVHRRSRPGPWRRQAS